MIKQNISAGTGAIQENVMVIRAKFQPLLENSQYEENMSRLIDAIPKMLDNVEALSAELNNAFNILLSAKKTD